jgi:uncharacterized protein YjiS (DUF1127 family)
MFNYVQSWRHRRRAGHTQRQLYALSDHILNDIGITRGDIGLVGRAEVSRITRNRA